MSRPRATLGAVAEARGPGARLPVRWHSPVPSRRSCSRWPEVGKSTVDARSPSPGHLLSVQGFQEGLLSFPLGVGQRKGCVFARGEYVTVFLSL